MHAINTGLWYIKPNSREEIVIGKRVEKYRSFYKRILITAISILLVVSVFNIIIDPYLVFHTPVTNISRLKPEAKRQERMTKITEFKLDRRKIDTVFIGTSRVDWTFDINHFKEITGKNASNMGIVGMNFNEYLEYIKLLIQIHPEIKNIYLGLDFPNFNKNIIDNNRLEGFNSSPNITATELATVLFASDTTVSSFITVSKNLKLKDYSKLYNENGLIYMFDNKNIDGIFRYAIYNDLGKFRNYEIATSYYDKLAELNLYCKSKGVTLHIFHTEGHAVDLATIYLGGYWNLFTQWKRDLTKVADVYDFYYVNKISTEEVKPIMKYFYDSIHGSPATSNLMMDKMILNKGDYGRLNTQSNIEKLTNQDTKNLENWLKENPKWVEIINNVKKEADKDAI